KLKYKNVQHEIKIKKEQKDILLKRREHLTQALGMTKVISPIDGVIIGKIQDKLGTVIKKGEAICQIVDVSSFLLEYQMEEKKARHAKLNQEVYIRFYAFPEKNYQGALKAIRPLFQSQIRRVVKMENVTKVYISLRESINPKLKPGMSAYINMHIGKTCLFKVICNNLKYLFLL
ncbi:efflux RND transporter periplasmic adaptor subunit, partial [Candidatus Auribacterota bacterium]